MGIWLLIVGLALLTLAIAGVSFTLVLLPEIVVREWLQNHPELIAQNGKGAIPPEFVADIRRPQTLKMLR
jgi:hypothetical protein